MAALLKPGGKIYITQTFQRRALPGMSVVKPLMKYCTTIDFGQLVFEPEAVGFVERAGGGLDAREGEEPDLEEQ